MNLLLPFYGLASLLALIGLQMRTQYDRTIIWLAGWGAMGVVVFATLFRQLTGDTGRYYETFKSMAGRDLADVWDGTDNNWGFVLLNWVLAQFGTHPLWLIAPITIFCIWLTHRSLRELFGPSDTAIVLLMLSAYPFFVFYLASGMKQAIAMALLLQGYVRLFQRRPVHAGFWLLLAPMFHTGALLVYPFVLVQALLWRRGLQRFVLLASIGFLLFMIALAATGLNRILMAPVEVYAQFSANYAIYFMDPATVDYRAGFRWDFTLFSFLPLLAAWWLRGEGSGISLAVSGWWLALYAQFASIYQLFAFAPFADRFAGFGWYLSPVLLMIMLVETGTRRPRQLVVLGFAVFNILAMQFYTGRALVIDI